MSTTNDIPFDEDTPADIGSLGPLPLSADAVKQAENATDILPGLRNDVEKAVAQDYIDTLPSNIQRRISGLKKLQFNYNELEAEFLIEVSKLEVKYQEKFQPLLTKRAAIISGSIEPKDDEVWCDHESAPEAERSSSHSDAAINLNFNEAMEQEISDQLTTKVTLNSPPNLDRGIPDFWLTTFKNVDLISDQIQEWDVPLLLDLEDVRVVFPDSEGLNFKLEFYFSENIFFTDDVLTKWYTVKCEVDPNNPFEFNGPEIVNCVGCEIHWKKGQNITKKIKKKKQKSKGRGQKTITRTVPQDSFFNFFSPPTIPEDISLLEEAHSTAIELDFTIAETLKERVIPRAVLYFTGEILLEGESSDECTSDSSSVSDEELRTNNSKHTRFKCDSDSEQSQETKQPTEEKHPECDKQVQ